MKMDRAETAIFVHTDNSKKIWSCNWGFNPSTSSSPCALET